MGNPEERMSKLLRFPYGSYLMIRLEYAIICGDELEAKIMRLIEMYMDNDRKKLLQEFINNTKDNKSIDQINITKDVWVPISYRLFMYDLYDLVKSENTLKRAIKNLQKKNFINVKFEQSNRYDAPKYQINVEVVQKELDKLQEQGKSGYQKLTPSNSDTLKNSYPQNLIPSESQNLIPSESDLSTSRGSNFDTNSRSNSNNNTEERESVVSSETNTDTPASSEISQDTHTEEKPKRKRATRKPRISKFVVPEEMVERVAKVYDHLDKWRQDITGDPEERFIREPESDEAICLLLQGKPPTPKRLEQVCNAMWNEPRNPRTGYYPREHMTVKAICNEVKAKSLSLTVSENKSQQKEQSYTLGGYTYKAEQSVPDLPFLGPQRNRNKRRVNDAS